MSSESHLKDVFGSDDESSDEEEVAVNRSRPGGARTAAAAADGQGGGGSGSGSGSNAKSVAASVGLESDEDDDDDDDDEPVKGGTKRGLGLDSDSSDEDALQDSDVEDSDYDGGADKKKSGSRLTKGDGGGSGNKKSGKRLLKRGAADGDSGSKSPAEKKARRRSGESEKQGLEQNAQQQQQQPLLEYDSDDMAPATAEDDDFIDNDDDDLDLVREYDEEDRNFARSKKAEAQEDGSFGKKKGRGSSSGGGDFDEDRKKDSWLNDAMNNLKRVKAQELRVEQKEKLAQAFCERMDRTAAEDERAVADGQPAMAKLKLLKTVTQTLSKLELQSTFLDYDVLQAMARWIKPYSNGALPNITVRKGIFALLLTLPAQTDHIKRGQIGKDIMRLWKHPEETAENKKILRNIIEKWNRPIFEKETNVRAFGAMVEERDPERSIPPIQRKTSASHGSKSPSSSSSYNQEEELSNILASSIKKKGNKNERVRVPYSTGFAFKVKPQSKIEPKAHRTQNKDLSTRAQLTKSMQKAGKTVSKNQRAEVVSVEGRKLKS